MHSFTPSLFKTLLTIINRMRRRKRRRRRRRKRRSGQAGGGLPVAVSTSLLLTRFIFGSANVK